MAERRRVTRALTAVQQQQAWDTSRSAADTPARYTAPLYYELSSSTDNEEPPPNVDKRAPNNSQRKRRRRRSIPSRSLELSFSSIEKDDVSGGEGACQPTSGRSRDRESCRASKEMTSTPRFVRATTARDSSLRSRWINVEHRPTPEMTTAAAVHREVDGHTTSSQSSVTRADVEARQSPESLTLQGRKRRRRRRSSDNEDPDWRRYPAKPARRLSPSASTSSRTCPATSYEPAGYDDCELDVLVELQRRLASTTDGHVLRRVVEIIEASGRYHVEDATFDFDLCSLDRGTITQLRHCLAV